MKQSIIIMLLCLFGFTSQAQTPGDYDLVKLNNGTTLVGKIIKYEFDEYLVIKTEYFDSLTVMMKDISYYGSGDIHNKRKEYKEMNKPYYFSFEAGLLANQEDISPSLQIAVHKRMSSRLFLGLGTGVNIYNYQQEEISYPLFVSARAYLLNQNMRPYFELNTGYGFSFANEEIGIIDARGGIMLNPRFGIKVGSGDMMMSVFAGFKFQKANYNIITWGGEYEKRINHKRIELGFGLMF